LNHEVHEENKDSQEIDQKMGQILRALRALRGKKRIAWWEWLREKLGLQKSFWPSKTIVDNE
jgi:hypothetical protein